MSTNPSTSDNANTTIRPGSATSEKLGAGQVVRPWARAVADEEAEKVMITQQQLKEIEAQLGYDIDV